MEASRGQARIVLGACAADQGHVLVSVDDDGPGIPESVRATIFKPFITTKQDGNGFGLAICKKIVEEHGGTLQAGPSALGGARFEIRLARKP
jgi:signal transduction histidine kinase